jgi:hypothetical protein
MEKTIAKHDARLLQLEKWSNKVDGVIDCIHEMRADMKHLTSSLKEFIMAANLQNKERGERVGDIEGRISAIEPIMKKCEAQNEKHEARLIVLESAGSRKWEAVVNKAFNVGGMLFVAYVVWRMESGQ